MSVTSVAEHRQPAEPQARHLIYGVIWPSPRQREAARYLNNQ